MNRISHAQPWGTLPDGRSVHRWTLRNATGMSLDIGDLGATLLSWIAPDRNGRFNDILLGHAEAGQYVQGDAYLGAIVGRWANRIRGGQFRLDGIDYRLDRNDGPNHLHGGPEGFHQSVWQVEPDGDALHLQLVSPEGEGGFPGELSVDVRYRLDDDGTLAIDYEAQSNAPTPVNLTAHPFFNLNPRHQDIRDYMLWIDADQFLSVDDCNIPIAREMVAGTAFDFRHAAPLGARLHWPHRQLALAGGFNHCYCLRTAPNEPHAVAQVVDPASGRRLTVSTDQPGLQLYSGHRLGGVPNRDGGRYAPFAGFALEAQAFPDQINSAEAEAVVLRPGDTYRQRTRYRVDCA
jgi:aldose 1-epimerase